MRVWGLGLKYLAAVFVWEIRQELKIRLQYSQPVREIFDNRMGKDAQVYLGSAELASICALLGYIPSKEEYLNFMRDKISEDSSEIYKYLNFDQLTDYNKEFIEITSLD